MSVASGSERRLSVEPGCRSRPLVTVVVPVYNGGEDIVENVETIRSAVAGGLGGEEVELLSLIHI